MRVDGRRIARKVRRRYLALHKPRGYVTTRSDPHRRKTVLDLIPDVREYVYPVGRLDYDSEGLLLLTNDGALAAVLTHPRHAVTRVYEALGAACPAARGCGGLPRLEIGRPADGSRPVRLLHPAARLAERRAWCASSVARTATEPGAPHVRAPSAIRCGGLRRTRLGPVSVGLPPGAARELTPAEWVRCGARPGRPLPARSGALAGAFAGAARPGNAHEVPDVIAIDGPSGRRQGQGGACRGEGARCLMSDTGANVPRRRLAALAAGRRLDDGGGGRGRFPRVFALDVVPVVSTDTTSVGRYARPR